MLMTLSFEHFFYDECHTLEIDTT